jgi:hypothetical protein
MGNGCNSIIIAEADWILLMPILYNFGCFELYKACLLSYFGIASNLFRFVELINLNPESAKQFSVSRKIIYSCLMALINMRIYQFYSIIGDDFADIIMANTYSF